MPEQMNVSPLLDGFSVGTPVGGHFGVCCYPAVRADSQRKYIIKVISIPASQTQLDALLITGAYKDSAQAAEYFRTQAEDIVKESALLETLAQLEGFVPFEGCQLEPMQKNRIGYEVYLLSGFRLSLERYMNRHTVSHLEAVNLGIDLCTALAASRKAGMLYADLKPSNIYISNKKEYKIGDLGFIPLDALRFTPMPEKYRSSYTAPELMDDLSVLNETADTYSAGLILYQIFNNGTLPEDRTKSLPAPTAADEEMAGIVLKACAPDPSKRWQNPEEMRQALIDYMQRGTINNVPIMEPIRGRADQPPAQEEDTEAAPAEEAAIPAPEAPEAESCQPEDAEETPEEPQAKEVSPAEETAAPEEPPVEAPAEENEAVLPDETEGTEAPMETDDVLQLSVTEDETGSAESISYYESFEAIGAADDLTADSYSAVQEKTNAEEVPAPPETDDDMDPDTAQEFASLTAQFAPTASASIGGDELDQELQALNQLLRASEKPVSHERKQTPNVAPVVIKQPKKKESAVGVLFTIFLLCLLMAAGVWGYMYYSSEYLQTVNGITVEEQQGKLVVTVDSDVRDGLLNVVCTDPYGNAFTQPVQDGKAEFSQISAGTFYTVQVQIEGMHKLTKPVSQVYSTKGTVTVSALNAGAGTQDGTVVISMVLDGMEPDRWDIYYSADGEAEQTQSFTGHSVTISGLTIGRQYTFRLEAVSGESSSTPAGQSTVQFTPIALIAARDLSVTAFSGGNLTVQWNNTSSTEPDSWIVHCTGEGYDETATVYEHQAVFSGISTTRSYNVEVYANGMTQSTRISISANPITLTNFQVDDSNPQELTISWQFEGTAPEGGWQVIYTLDSSSLPSAVKAADTSAVVAPRIPGAVYRFTIQAADDTSVFGGAQVYHCPDAEDFTSRSITAGGLTAKLLVTPTNADWMNQSVPSDSFTQSFTSGQPISVVLQNQYGVYLTDMEEFSILYVFRDASGDVAPEWIGEDTATWRELWGKTSAPTAALDIPVAPTEAGSYTLDIYFNGLFVASAPLIIQ